MSQDRSSSHHHHHQPLPTWASGSVPRRQELVPHQHAGSIPSGSQGPTTSAPGSHPPPSTHRLVGVQTTFALPNQPVVSGGVVARSGQPLVFAPPMGSTIAGPSTGTGSTNDRRSQQDGRFSQPQPPPLPSLPLAPAAVSAALPRPHPTPIPPPVMPRPLVPSLSPAGGAGGGASTGWIPPPPLPKVPLSKPPTSIQVAPVKKIRKRHKVAKSCDGCRQNKRRCDNEMPCSNCRRRNYDCTYTSAQLSRSTWGDTPLSPEKLLGSKAMNTITGGPVSGANSTAPPSSKPILPAPPSLAPSTPVPILPATPTAIRPLLPADPSKLLPVAPKVVSSQQDSRPAIRSEPRGGVGSRARSQSLTTGGSGRGEGGGGFAAEPEDLTDYGRWEGAMSIRAHRSAQMARVAHMAFIPSGSSSSVKAEASDRPHQDAQKDNPAIPTTSASKPSTAVATISSSSSSVTASTPSPTPTTQQPQPATPLYSSVVSPSPSAASGGSPALSASTNINHQHTGGSPQPQEKTKSQRFQKIAADILSLREYDGAMYLPRHIDQPRGRFWAPPAPSQNAEQMPFRHLHPQNQLAQFPPSLKVLPRDAEYLIHVYFKFSYYYAPFVNKSVALMHLFEPDKQAHDYFLLNVLFMGACKHLGRRQDIQRAIEFRDRAKALEKIVDLWKLPRIQASTLGTAMVYGVFFGTRSYIEHVGVYRKTNKDRGHIHPRTLLLTRGSISEASYQSRLWLFWAIYVRDCINRLYWGWPCGVDPCSMQAELPEIEGCVGLGGTLVRTDRSQGRSSSTPLAVASIAKRDSSSTSSIVPVAPKPGATALDVDRGLLFAQPKQAIGKKRDSEMNSRRSESSSGKRQLRAAPGDNEGPSSDRQAWRGRSRSYDDDDDDEDEDDRRPGRAGSSDDDEASWKAPRINHNPPQSTAKRPARPYDMLNLQSKGDIQVEDADGTYQLTVSTSDNDASEFDIQPGLLQEHLDRMEYLLNAEDDVTDDGTYCRAIFLQEVKLWAIGNRLALYLASDRAVRPKYPTVSFGERQSDVIAATMESGRYSERAWAMDRELQNLQAELIQWERELPDHMRFRMDYDQPDVDHRVNGKLAVLMMHYYTITLMLQSAWLPTPLAKETESLEGRALSSPSVSTLRASSTEAPSGSITDSPRHSVVSSPMSTPSTPSNSLSSPSPSAKSSSMKPTRKAPAFQPAFLNTAHEICTELSHVLLRQLDLCLTRYPEWCRIQAKVNHCIIVALRVCCVNAHLITNDAKTRSEAKAGFAAGSEYLKMYAMLPEPLTVRDRPQEEEIRIMEELESDFAKMALIRENMDVLNEAMEESDDEMGANALVGGFPTDGSLLGNYGEGNGTALLTSDQLPSSVVDQDPVAQLETLYSEHFPEDIFLKGRLEFGVSHEGFGYDFDYEDEWG